MRKSTLLLAALTVVPLVGCMAKTTSKVSAVPQVQLDRYLGTWYEIARKPMYFQKKCAKNVTANYALNKDGTVAVTNRCITHEGKEDTAHGQAFSTNPPQNSQLKVSFLPQAIRWLPVGRGDYWILKLDTNYQVALVGDPKRKYLWVLSRTPHISADTWQEYRNYAKQIGYDISDLNLTPQD